MKSSTATQTKIPSGGLDMFANCLVELVLKLIWNIVCFAPALWLHDRLLSVGCKNTVVC